MFSGLMELLRPLTSPVAGFLSGFFLSKRPCGDVPAAFSEAAPSLEENQRSVGK